MEGRKKYYGISEVAERFELEQSVLRFWEGEFSLLRPQKNRAGRRAYVDRDLSIVEKIKYLLYDEKFTIEGANSRLEEIKDMPLERYIQLSKVYLDTSFWDELEEISRIL